MEFKSIKMSSRKLYLSFEESLIARLNKLNLAVFLETLVFLSMITCFFLR